MGYNLFAKFLWRETEMDRRVLKAEAESCADIVNYIVYFLGRFFTVDSVRIEIEGEYCHEAKISAYTSDTIKNYSEMLQNPKYIVLRYSLSKLRFFAEERDGFLTLSCYKIFSQRINKRRMIIKIRRTVRERFPEKEIMIYM